MDCGKSWIVTAYPRRALTVAMLVALGAGAATSQQPSFRQRLQLPVARDDIAYGQAVTVDPHTGEVFVCDPRTNRILVFNREGFFTYQILGGDNFAAPEDLAVDPDGFLLLLASRGFQRLPLELDFDGEFRREIPLQGLTADLVAPALISLALSPDGKRLYLLDATNFRLWITDREGRIEGSVDLTEGRKETEGDLFLGQVDVYGDNVLVAVPSHGEIRRFDLDGTLIDRVGIKGTSQCELGGATAAALTEDDEFLVIDQQRMFLMRWTPKGNRCLGQYLGLGISDGFLYYPYDIALDDQGRVYIAQSFDGKIQVFEGMAAAAGPD
jgi:sugar lactone lactonase YvrE